MNRSTVTTISILVVAFLAGGISYYGYLFNHNAATEAAKQKAQVDSSIQNGMKLLLKGNASTAIPVFEESVANATDMMQESRANLSLGISYLGANLPEKGITLLKEVSLNTSYPAGYRSSAAQAVLEYYIGGKNVDFALNTIFTGPTWGDFMTGNTRDVSGIGNAVIKAYEWVTALIPSFPAEYSLASQYADRVLGASSAADRAKYAGLAEGHIKAGDIAYAEALDRNKVSKARYPNDVPPFPDVRLGIGVEDKALALSELYEVNATHAQITDIVTVFKQALVLLEEDGASNGSIVSGSFTRYHLAVLLARTDASKYSQEIVDTLTPLYNPSLNNSVFNHGFLKAYGTDPRYYKTRIWEDTIALAKIDARFKTLLLSLGWKATDLK